MASSAHKKVTDEIKQDKPRAWWESRTVKMTGIILLSMVLFCYLFWFIRFRPYVSTDDARISGSIVKIANLGTSGQITSVKVKEGDFITVGMVLAELDHRTALAQLDRARARERFTSLELSRMESLVSQRGASQRDLDRTRADALSASADTHLAEIALERTYVRSPINGVIIQKNAESGNILEGNQTAFIAADVNNAWVSANIEETSIADVHPGQKVHITIDEGGSLTGKVDEVRSAAASTFALIPSDNASGNFIKVVQRIPVKIVLDPHPELKLRVGQSVEIRIRVK